MRASHRTSIDSPLRPSVSTAAKAAALSAVALSIVLAVTASLPLPAEAGELIRYQRADGRLGFASDEATIPEGATVLSRGRTTPRSARAGGRADVPSVGQLVERVRKRCRKRWGRDSALFRICLAAQTDAAFRYRDLLLAQPADSPARGWLRGCRGTSQMPDFESVAECAEQATAAHAQNPLPTLKPRPGRARSAPAARAQPHRNDRLQQLREDQSRSQVEQSRGRAEWGPRYRKARSEYDQAVERTADVLARMRQRGCRRNSLACGSLRPRLEEARRVEDEKRDYLNNRLPEECRRAGCQPGWLR